MKKIILFVALLVLISNPSLSPMTYSNSGIYGVDE